MLVWHALESHVEQLAQSASGVLHLMPLGSAALSGEQRRAGGRGEGQLKEAFEHGSCVVCYKVLCRLFKRRD